MLSKKSHRERSRHETLLDTTPMADIVFLLLIFFMLSTSFIVNPGIRIKLPKAVTSEIELGRTVIVEIPSTGRIFVNGKAVSLTDLPQILDITLSDAQEKMVIIKADKTVSHGIVVKVMDIAKIAGAERLVIATEPE